MSKRSNRFRASVAIPELGGKVVVRGLSPDALRAIAMEHATDEEIATTKACGIPHAAIPAIFAAGCVRPRLSEEQITELSRSSLDALADAIMGAHPQTRRMLAKESR